MGKCCHKLLSVKKYFDRICTQSKYRQAYWSQVINGWFEALLLMYTTQTRISDQNAKHVCSNN